MFQAYRRAIDFGGRSSRPELGRRAALAFATAAGLAVVLAVFDSVGMSVFRDELVNVVCMIAFLALQAATLLALAAAAGRRLHDIDRSAAWVAIALVPFGIVVLLAWLILPGTRGPNRFGPAPERADGLMTAR
jgi:uncharacterized membrane protein YhaH (DUF805 family)